MDKTARERQKRYRARRKEAGYRRLEVWVPADVLKELERRYRPTGAFQRPQTALIELARRALRFPRPLEPWERYRNFPTP